MGTFLSFMRLVSVDCWTADLTGAWLCTGWYHLLCEPGREQTASPHLCCPPSLSTIQENVEKVQFNMQITAIQIGLYPTKHRGDFRSKFGQKIRTVLSWGRETILFPMSPPIFQDLQDMRVSWKELFEKPRDTWNGTLWGGERPLRIPFPFNASMLHGCSALQ